MKPFLVAGLLLLALPVAASAPVNEATVFLTSLSMRVPPASYSTLGLQYRLGFTTTDDDTLNHEIFAGGGTGQYESTAVIEYPGSEALGPIVGFLSLDTPLAGDLNINGITDFLEVDRSITQLATTGTIEIDDGIDFSTGTVQATWNRAAGATTGTVRLRVDIPDFGLANLVFDHSFEIFSYRGTLTYTPGESQIPGSVQLQRLGAAGSFAGPMNLVRLSAGELDRVGATWKGPGGLDFDVLGSNDLEGVPTPISYVGRTLYAGLVIFGDGDPTTPFTDEYDFYDLIVSDPNDGDGDGLPDLSDPVAVAPPGDVTLQAVWVQGSVRIRISGAPGTQHAVEHRASLADTPWNTVAVIALDAAGRAEVDVGTPDAGEALYRTRSLP